MQKLQREVANCFMPAIVLAIKYFIRNNNLENPQTLPICRMLEKKLFKNYSAFKIQCKEMLLAITCEIFC